MGARDTALGALIACRKTGAWSDGVLKEYLRRDNLDSRDAALASRLCYGVIQNRTLLDFYLSSVTTGPLRKLQPVVLDILRLGAYQITMLDKIPVSAAVNEAVQQGKRYANHKAAGLINAVLRALSREKEQLPQPPDLATKYSHPAPLVALLRENVGGELLEPLLQSDNQSPETVVQVNTLRCSESALKAHWEEQGITYQSHPWLPGCFLLSGTGSIGDMESFSRGWIQVQDAAACLSVRMAGLEPGMHVLDCCAAPGGKSFAAAMEMEDRGEIFGCDLHAHKLPLIEKSAQRLGISCIKTFAKDARELPGEWWGQMDAVLADVPCSGLGVIRKKPDIRWKDLEATEALPQIQGQILDSAAEAVRPGGVLLYSTCTVLRRENESVIQAFLERRGDFSLEAMDLPKGLPSGADGMVTLLPCLHDCDGFFFAKLRRRT